MGSTAATESGHTATGEEEDAGTTAVRTGVLRSNRWTTRRWASLERWEMGMEMDPGHCRRHNRREPPRQIKKEEERRSQEWTWDGKPPPLVLVPLNERKIKI